MANIIAIHSVGDIDTWLSKNNRARLFPEVAKSYRLYRVPGENRVAIFAEGVDVERLQQLLSSDQGKAAMEEDTVLQPVEVLVEIEGAK